RALSPRTSRAHNSRRRGPPGDEPQTFYRAVSPASRTDAQAVLPRSAISTGPFKIASRQSVEWADIACSCGYFDQAHFVHDLQAFAGLNPTTYLSYQIEYPNFVPVDDWR